MSTEMNPTTGLRVDLFGPTVEFLTSPQEASIDFCVLRGVIPSGVSVPLHSQRELRLAGHPKKHQMLKPLSVCCAASHAADQWA
jgi:hypothetical protein